MSIVKRIGDILPAKIRESYITGYLYYNYLRKPFNEQNINLDHDMRVIFVHNPKAAGTSVKQALGLPTDRADHTTPTKLVHKKTWEDYFSFTVVRHPIDRLLSSYFYHTSSDYRGFYFQNHPNIHDMSFKEYFYMIKEYENAVDPQVKYINHQYSEELIDRVCRFEDLPENVNEVLANLGIGNKLPKKNSSARDIDNLEYSAGLLKEIIRYYKDDFEVFGYENDIDLIEKRYLSS